MPNVPCETLENSMLTNSGANAAATAAAPASAAAQPVSGWGDSLYSRNCWNQFQPTFG